MVRRCVFSSSTLSSTLPRAIPPAFRKFAANFLSLVFPDNCRVCERPLTEFSRVPVCTPCLTDPAPFAAEFFCARCRAPFLNRSPLDDAGLCGVCRRGAPAFDAAYAYGFYDGTLAKLVRTYKYGRVQTLARPLGGLLSAALPRDEAFDVIAPMPLHWRKRWQRGFNQSELLARELARRTGIPVRRAVKRVRFTNAQAGLTGHQRRDNVSGAFRGVERVARGKRVLLIDDVLTTGATAAACARALKMSGAARVTILTLARADRRVDVTLFPRSAMAGVGEF